MTAYLIYNKFESERNKTCIDFYFQESKLRGIELTLLLEEELTISVIDNQLVLASNDEPLKKPDFVICRTMNPMLSWQLEQLGIRVFNNSMVSEICNDKMRCYTYVASLGVPVPNTLYNCELSVFSPYPLVIKPTDGKGGKHVFLLHSYEEFLSAKDEIGNHPYVIQRPMEAGMDLRVYVIGKEIITSILRISCGDFRSNFCLGGQAQLYTLSPKEREVVQKIIDGFDFDYVGIDFLFQNGKLVFNEIEDVVGARMVYDKTDINIVGLYLDHILKKM